MNNILHVSCRADMGGGPKHIIDLLEGGGGKWRNFVAAPDKDSLSDTLRQKCIKFFPLPHRRFSIAAFISLIWWCFRENIDLIHSHGRGGGIYSRLLSLILRVPVVHTHHGIYLENLSGIKRYLFVSLERILNLLTCKVIFVSRSELNACRKVGALSTKKSVVIPNGVQVPPFIKRHPHMLPLNLLAISRLASEKNNEDLIRIAYECRNKGLQVQLKIAGDGPERMRLIELIKQLNLDDSVELLGNQDDVLALIYCADAYITSSFGEAHSIAMLEAMAGGLPVIATNVRGHCDVVIHGENGYLFNLRDYANAVRILEKFSSDRGHAIQCGVRARELVEKQFSRKKMLASIASLYNDILIGA